MSVFVCAAVIVAIVSKEAVAFMGLFEAKPTKIEMEKVDALFKNYSRAPDVNAAVAALPTVKKLNRTNRSGVSPSVGFYFGAVKSSLVTHRAEWEAAKRSGGKEIACAINAALTGKTIDDLVPKKMEDYAPGILDLLWGYFLATGAAEVPRRVIQRGGMKVPDEPGVVDLTARAAQWSSVSLAKDHPTVLSELEAFALNADEKDVRNFFGPALGDAECAVLSPVAIARIVSCGVAEKTGSTEDELHKAFPKANEVVPSVREVSLADVLPSIAGTNNVDVVAAARRQIGVTVGYDPAYVRLAYPGGDVPRVSGVCTDVIIRALRDARRVDLQKRVHEDMKANFAKYPQNWGLKRTDPNIDHRRVPNLQCYFKRKGWSLKVTKTPFDYEPGDFVTVTVGGRLPHIMIVSDKKASDGTPLVIHNIGAGTKEENCLFTYPMTGHYRMK